VAVISVVSISSLGVIGVARSAIGAAIRRCDGRGRSGGGGGGRRP
jgi:hypothetical protein